MEQFIEPLDKIFILRSGNMILEEGKTPQFYSEAQTEQKYANLMQVFLFIRPKGKMQFW